MSKIRVKPIEFMIQFKDEIIEAYEENNKNSQKTWNKLESSLPELKQVMKTNTFKQYLSVLIPFNAELDKIKAESVKARNEVIQIKEKNKKLSNHSERKPDKLDKVRQKDGKVRQRLDKSGKISGWNVRKAKDGYYRCYRKIKGKVHCIYIGKKIDRDKAMTRIKKKEECLRLDIS